MEEKFKMALIQFKRGTSQRWSESDYILQVGEPGYDTDTGRMKIGDGVHLWKDLLFQDEKAVVSRPSVQNFPAFPDKRTIYKDESTCKLYQAKDGGGYELIGTENVLEYELINGGNANGTT